MLALDLFYNSTALFKWHSLVHVEALFRLWLEVGTLLFRSFMEKCPWFLPTVQIWSNRQWLVFDLGLEGKGCSVPAPSHISFIFITVSYQPSSTSGMESCSSCFTHEEIEVQGDQMMELILSSKPQGSLQNSKDGKSPLFTMGIASAYKCVSKICWID